MFNIAIDGYDRENHAVVVGATVDYERHGGYLYRDPILNFVSEGEARRFVRTLKQYALSSHAEWQLEQWAKQYAKGNRRPVRKYDIKIEKGEIKAITIWRSRSEEDKNF